ncbi:unnamed protein product [Citrullus colocynthis]|uniref:Uncharacterized protein n=1 Tax=Citrullus colocynthis TaxID=252529 RepID=A0ABP0YNE1_9ROSI
MTDREDQKVEVEEKLKNNSEIGNTRMMTDREDQNIEAEGKRKNNSEIELSNQESAEKQRKNEVVVAPFTSSRKEKLRIATYELYNMEKRLTKKLFRSWNRSYLPSEEETEKKMREGRVVIKDEPHKSIQENTIFTATSRKGKEKIDLDEDLSIIHDLIVRFILYVDNVEEMATNREKSEDDWIRHYEVGIKELQNINEILKKLIMTNEMLRMREKQSEKYIKFVEIMCKLEEINSFLDETHHIGVVTEKDLTEIELRICELHLKRCNNDLDELGRISLLVCELHL